MAMKNKRPPAAATAEGQGQKRASQSFLKIFITAGGACQAGGGGRYEDQG